MSLTKLHKTIKKYRELHAKHEASWKVSQDRINRSDNFEKCYMKESYQYNVKGNDLFNDFIKDLEGLAVFPKKPKK